MTTAPSDHLATLADLQEQFRSTIEQVDPTTRVPWCGRWRVTNLVVHLGRVHHWAASQAARTREVPLGRGPFDLEPFYAAQAAELHATLVRLGPDALGSTLDGPGPASFWHRRQVHETLVHLWDLRTAGGLALQEAPALWADTVDEVVTVMHPRQVRLGRTPPLTRRIALVAADAARTWELAASDEAPHDIAATVTGPAQSLALLVWGRTSPDDAHLRVDGDRAWLEECLAHQLTP
ncbi:maleylpyruvate isomerase family mycothiol-dependent enzyme [Cellulomonas soli]